MLKVIGVIVIAALLLVSGYFLVSGVQTGAATAPFSQKNEVMLFCAEKYYRCSEENTIVESLRVEGYNITYMDISEHKEYIARYDVNTTHLPIFLSQNGARLQGFQGRAALRSWLESHA